MICPVCGVPMPAESLGCRACGEYFGPRKEAVSAEQPAREKEDAWARFFAGLGFGFIIAGITRLITSAEPWWLVAGMVAACLVWFSRRAMEALHEWPDNPPKRRTP